MDEIQRILEDLEALLRSKDDHNGLITYQETKVIFQSLGLDEDLIGDGGSVIHAVFYIILKQAQKTKQLESRIEELEKLSHEHFDPSKFGPA